MVRRQQRGGVAGYVQTIGRFRQSLLLTFAVAFSAIVFTTPAQSSDMVFLPKCVDKKNRVQSDGNRSCGSDQRRVLVMFGRVAGDSADRFRRAIRGQRFAEYWLVSGGGSVNAGLEIGRILRSRNAFVRVPNLEGFGNICASICTFAFLGGRVRTVHPKSRFLVHAASAYKDGFSLTKNGERTLREKPQEFLEYFSEQELGDSVDLFVRMFTYAQEMIGGRPQSSALHAVLRGSPRQWYRAYLGSDRFLRDVEELKRHGKAAANEVVMGFERTGVRGSLTIVAKELKKESHRLGHRAKPAWRIIDTMYNCRITDVCELNQTTLREFGYTNLVQ